MIGGAGSHRRRRAPCRPPAQLSSRFPTRVHWSMLPGPASASQEDLLLFDRKGGAEALKLPRGSYQFPRVSPDGKRIALETSYGKEALISIYELVRRQLGPPAHLWRKQSLPHLVCRWSARGVSIRPRWRSRCVLAAGRRRRRRAPHDTRSGQLACARVVVSDRRHLAVQRREGFQRVALDAFGSGSQGDGVRRRQHRPRFRLTPCFHPTAVGWRIRPEIRPSGEGTTFVQPFPPTGTKYQIARGGRPLWSRDGKELFFVPAPGLFMAVTVRTHPASRSPLRSAVPRGFGPANPSTPRTFDIMPDGRIVGFGIAREPKWISAGRRFASC